MRGANPHVLINYLYLQGFLVTDADFTGGIGAQQAVQPPPGAEGGADARLAELEARLTAVTEEAQKLREDWLRAKAETDNVRRRAQEDVAKAHRYGIEGFANELLAVRDSLEASLKVENAPVETYRQGVEITARQLDAAFEKYALKAIDPQGEKFDPHRHQAISQVESPQEPNTVVSVLQKGYLLNDRVLRPALVVVARGPSET